MNNYTYKCFNCKAEFPAEEIENNFLRLSRYDRDSLQHRFSVLEFNDCYVYIITIYESQKLK